MASCCAIGRSSADATNAWWIRAVRAACDPLCPCDLCFAELVAFLCVAALTVGVSAVSPVTGESAISTASEPESQRGAREDTFWEFSTLMLPM